jgi:hypothetical protein
MKSLSADIKQLLVTRIEQSSPAEILRIASGLAANEQIEAVSAVAARSRPLGAGGVQPRFTKLLVNGKVWLDPQDGECVAVYDSKTNLTWSHSLVAGGSRSWKDSLAAAAAVRLLGKDDWRAPTLEERLSINDYTRHSPALDTEYFAKESGWEWTSTPDAESPSGCAWVVDLGYGSSGRCYQSYHNCVRAVRAGQPFALSF